MGNGSNKSDSTNSDDEETPDPQIDINFTLGDLDGGLIKYTCENLQELQNRRLTKPPPQLPLEINTNSDTMRKHHSRAAYLIAGLMLGWVMFDEHGKQVLAKFLAELEEKKKKEAKKLDH